MGLMAIIAVALVVLAVQQFTKDSDDNATESATATSSDAAFDPLSSKTDDPNAEETPSGPLTTIKFDSYEHDFGEIKQDTKNEKTFTFTNTGTEPLIIESAKGSCGCTVPQYPKNPIAPGEQGEIEVVYSPGKQKELQNKNVTIVANTEPKQTILRIKALVEEVPGAASTATPGEPAQIQIGS